MTDIREQIEGLRRGFGGLVPPICHEAAHTMEQMLAAVDAARAVNATCHITSCKSPIGDEPLKLEQALVALDDGI